MWRYGEDARGTFVCSSTPTAVCPRVGGAQKANPSARKCPPGGDISPATPGFFALRASRGSWLAHVNRELGEVAALRAPSTSGVVSSPHLLSSLGGWRGPSWLDAWLEKTLRPGGSREPLDPPYFYGSRTSLSKLSIPVLAALRARCGRWCSPARSRSLLLACLALGLYMYI